MGFFEDLGNRRWKREGEGKPAPASGRERFFFLLLTHFWKLIILNLLFILFSLPVITLPAALCAMNRVLIKLVREGNCLLWMEFRDEFKRSFLKSLPPGLIFGAMLALCYYLFSMSISYGESLYGVIFYSLGFTLLIITAVLGTWTFVLMAMLSLSVREILTNARALTFMEWKRDLAIIGINAAALLIETLLFPFSLPVIALLLFSLAQYAICFTLNTAVQMRIIEPYEDLEARDRETNHHLPD